MFDWRTLVGAVAERVAALLVDSRPDPSERQPTPLTGTNRSAGRPSARARPARPPRPPRVGGRACAHCGERVGPGRRVCNVCLPAERAEGVARLVAAGVEGLQRSRVAGRRPGLSKSANRARGQRVAEHLRAAAAWSGEKRDPAEFKREVLPALAGMSARQVASRTGISVSYAAAILRGERVPRQRLWHGLRSLQLRDVAPVE